MPRHIRRWGTSLWILGACSMICAKHHTLLRGRQLIDGLPGACYDEWLETQPFENSVTHSAVINMPLQDVDVRLLVLKMDTPDWQSTSPQTHISQSYQAHFDSNGEFSYAEAVDSIVIRATNYWYPRVFEKSRIMLPADVCTDSQPYTPSYTRTPTRSCAMYLVTYLCATARDDATTLLTYRLRFSFNRNLAPLSLITQLTQGVEDYVVNEEVNGYALLIEKYSRAAKYSKESVRLMSSKVTRT